MRYRCSVCARLRSPDPAVPHSLHPSAREFGDLVALVTFTPADCEGNIKLFLNTVDFASRLGLTLRPAKLRWIPTGKMVAAALTQIMSAANLATFCSAKALRRHRVCASPRS